MITKSILKEYANRRCPHLVYLMLDETRLLDFFKKLMENKIDPTDLIDGEGFDEEGGMTPFEYLRDYPLAYEKAMKEFQEREESDRVNQYIKENEDLQETSRLSMRYFQLRFGNCKRADTKDGSLSGEMVKSQDIIEANTIRLMKDKSVNVILEGQVRVGHLRARYDALVRNNEGSFDLYEVKGSGIIAKRNHEEPTFNQKLKTNFFYDLGFQYRVYREANLPLRSINFIGANRQFVRTSEIYPLTDEELLGYFQEVSYLTYNKTDTVPLKIYYDEKLYLKNPDDESFEDLIDELIRIDAAGTDYAPECRYECRKGGACVMNKSCFTNLSNTTTLNICGNIHACGDWRKKKKIINDMQILEMKDISDEDLEGIYPPSATSEKNGYVKRSVPHMQIAFAKNKFNHKHIIETDKINELLNEYRGKTLVFFDFESFQYALPLVKDCTPWSQVCSQYSMHICRPDYDLKKHDYDKGIGGGIKHYEFLGNPIVDKFTSPEPALLETLIDQLADFGLDPYHDNYAVVVYNKSFEQTRLKDMGKRFPKYNDFCMAFHDHVVDLLDFFTRGYWYHQDFGPSLSLKTTQPVLMHDEKILGWYSDLPYNLLDTLNYKDGIIHNGGIALDIYQTLLRRALMGKPKDVLYDELRGGLLAYCKIDSWGTVILYDTIVKAYDKIKNGTIDLDIDTNNTIL